jgi:hypothetical protein
VPLAGDDDGVDDGGAVPGIGMADEHPVFFPIAEGRIAFSMRLLSSRERPWSQCATRTSQ